MQRRFSEEFKRAAVARVQSGESQLSVARHLGISSKTLNRWCVTARRAMPAEELSAMDEIARLRKLLRQREAEIDFLKKQRRTSPKCRKEVHANGSHLKACSMCFNRV